MWFTSNARQCQTGLTTSATAALPDILSQHHHATSLTFLRLRCRISSSTSKYQPSPMRLCRLYHGFFKLPTMIRCGTAAKPHVHFSVTGVVSQVKVGMDLLRRRSYRVFTASSSDCASQPHRSAASRSRLHAQVRHHGASSTRGHLEIYEYKSDSHPRV